MNTGTLTVMSHGGGTYQSQAIESQTIPTKGKQDAALEAAITETSRRWTNAYGWKESIEYSYLTSQDWRINHHV